MGDATFVDPDGAAVEAGAIPPYEAGLHCGIFRRFPDVGTVLRGHSMANTVLSRRAGDTVRLAGYELPKAFPGGPTHDVTVDVPVLDNDQDIPPPAGPGRALPGDLIRAA